MNREIAMIASIALVAVLAIYHPFVKRDDDGKAAPDIKYEEYCDSIWYTDRAYYLEVLTETEEYKQYIEEYGEWWNR